jgi:hypothetical protein
MSQAEKPSALRKGAFAVASTIESEAPLGSDRPTPAASGSAPPPAGVSSGDNGYALKLVDDRLPVIPFKAISIRLALLVARAAAVSLM